MLKSRSMDVVWSVQFLIALVCFMTPTIVAARLVYRRIVASGRRREQVVRRVVQPQVQQASQPSDATVVVCAEAAPVTLASMHQPIVNLRERLVEFRASLQRSSAALGHLQECDWQVSGDLNRASQIMHQAFAENAPVSDGVPLGPHA